MVSVNLLLIAGLLVFSVSILLIEGNTKAHFPVSTSVEFPRVRLIGTLPVLREFTFCAWVRIYDMTGRSPFVFSYATTVSDNEMAILFHTVNNLTHARLHIGAPFIDFHCFMLDTDLKRESWNHLCVTWFSPSGRATVFVNSNKCMHLQGSSQVSSGGHVRSGGVAIIGQDQDAVDSKFQPSQGWYGDIADVHLWDEVLNQSQIEEAGRCGGKRKTGNVIGWLKTQMTTIDGAELLETQLCEP